MMVTFVSQCEKKSLNKTRRVLDAFANRIGNRTWQTVITNEGLIAVKKLLRKTASKNTAVSCHWIRSRSRSEFIWVVGNKDKFNTEGVVPVNYTQQDISQYKDKATWKTLDVIQYASSIAGLFHDFGKANELFQNKINKSYKPQKGEKKRNYEPYRHEWISYKIFIGFVEGKEDSKWLDELSEIKEDSFTNYYKTGLPNKDSNDTSINQLNPLAQLIAWLILTHHRLPLVPSWLDEYSSVSLQRADKWRSDDFRAIWNSYKCEDEELKELLEANWTLKHLPSESYKWRSHTSNTVSEAITRLQAWVAQGERQTNWLDDQLFTAHLSRLCLMMADHFYSAQEEVTPEWRGKDYKVYANTYRTFGGVKHPKNGEYKQQLDEHLIGVAHHAKNIAKALPKLNTYLPSLDANKSELEEKVSKEEYKEKFGWQDKAKKIARDIGKSTNEQGFFGINMASTGRGKTLANAKIMYAIGSETGRRRFNVAIGLRSLTLQTGKEFQKVLKLSNEDLAIAVGGASVKQLFEYQQRQATNSKQVDNTAENAGSESADEYIDPDLYVHYKGQYVNHSLSEWTKSKDKEQLSKLDSLLLAPVLVCTIDHLMPACEGTKGGKQIAPMLRLLSSDLILDEPDDFGLDDLPALCRLVHWSAMLGSRVLLSTATMPPDLAYALFRAYQAGWSHYAKANIENWSGEIACAWFDEFDKPENHCISKLINTPTLFDSSHDKFVKKRIKELEKNTPPQRKGKIITVDRLDEETIVQSMARVIQTNLIELHQHHHQCNDDKTVSIGLIRMANINPLVAVAKAMLEREVIINDTCIHYCVYHSRYPLAIRSYLEGKLDETLNRKNPNAIWESKSEIQKTLKNHKQKHHVFVVLASPVAEVGRDHDYDWMIVEPSSMRSIIQLAGRLLRHRNIIPKYENLLILNKNYRALKSDTNKKGAMCFEKPGFESKGIRISNNDLNHCLEENQYNPINATPRITLPNIRKDDDGKYINLSELEHHALRNTLFNNDGSAKMWWKNKPHWCGEMQKQQRFRDSQKDEAFYLWLTDVNSMPEWKWKNEAVYPADFGETSGGGFSIKKSKNKVTIAKGNYFWFNLDASSIYENLVNDPEIYGDKFIKISKQFGEVRLTSYNKDKEEVYQYHKNLGLYKELGEDK